MKFYHDIVDAEYSRAGIHFVSSPTSIEGSNGSWGFCQSGDFAQIEVQLKWNGKGVEVGHATMGPCLECGAVALNYSDGLLNILDQLKFPAPVDAAAFQSVLEQFKACAPTNSCAPSIRANFSNGNFLNSYKLAVAVFTILHEFGHSLGLYHEHVRRKVSEDDLKRLDKCRISMGRGEPYPNEGEVSELPEGKADFESIMFYYSSGYARPRTSLSPGDIATLRRAYEGVK